MHVSLKRKPLGLVHGLGFGVGSRVGVWGWFTGWGLGMVHGLGFGVGSRVGGKHNVLFVSFATQPLINNSISLSIRVPASLWDN